MHNPRVLFFGLLACFSVPLAARPIIPSPAASTTEYHVEGGLTFASGLANVVDQLETNFRIEDDSSWPIGIKLSAYARHANGFGYGVSIGPGEFIVIDENNDNDDDDYYDRDDDEWNYILPLSVDVRYYFNNAGDIAPYVRAGISYPITGGDYIGSGSPGPIAAIGAHFWHNDLLSIGAELGYDGSEIEVEAGPFHGAQDVKSTEFTFGVFVTF